MQNGSVTTMEDRDVRFAVDHGWQEIDGPSLFNFNQVGARICANLVKLTSETIQGREVAVAYFDNGERQCKVRLSFDLEQKINKSMVGRAMLIIFDHEDESTKGKGNAMKVFKVFVAPEGDKASAVPFQASDADLPANF